MLSIPSQVQETFKQNLKTLDLNFFEFTQEHKDLSLLYLLSYLVREYDLVRTLNLNEANVNDFWIKLVQGFNDQPYHNVAHSFNTVFFMGFLFQHGFDALLTKLEMLAMLLACAIHDYDHPGFDNSYLIKTGHEWALLYNDQSPLQNHFVWKALTLLKESNIFVSIKEEEYLSFRKKVTNMVMATDFANWGVNIYVFDHRQDLDPKGSDKEILHKVAMAACDFNDPALDFDSYKEMMLRIAKEYEMQNGKKEERIGGGNYWWVENITVPTYERLEKIVPAVRSWIARANENKYKMLQY